VLPVKTAQSKLLTESQETPVDE